MADESSIAGLTGNVAPNQTLPELSAFPGDGYGADISHILISRGTPPQEDRQLAWQVLWFFWQRIRWNSRGRMRKWWGFILPVTSRSKTLNKWSKEWDIGCPPTSYNVRPKEQGLWRAWCLPPHLEDYFDKQFLHQITEVHLKEVPSRLLMHIKPKTQIFLKLRLGINIVQLFPSRLQAQLNAHD